MARAVPLMDDAAGALDRIQGRLSTIEPNTTKQVLMACLNDIARQLIEASAKVDTARLEAENAERALRSCFAPKKEKPPVPVRRA